MNRTACPLDCYDSCEIIYENGKIRGSYHPVTDGYLCPFLNSYEKYPRIKTPKFNQKEIDLEKAIDTLYEKLQIYKNNLFYKSSGNIGQMQNVTNLLFEKLGFTFTKGSLCDSAGGVGIEMGRNGVNLNMPFSEIKKSEVVIVWGRDISDTNSHLYNIIKDKTLIVIDPIKTKIAKEAELFIQIKPRQDFYLAILLCRFILINQMEDREFIENFTEDFEFFKDLILSFRINRVAKEREIDLLDIIKILEIIENRRVAILVGIGVQKYSIGDQILRVIDSFAGLLGLFNKEGSGVNYLSNSSTGFKNPFSTTKNFETKALANFSKYDLIFIQGANPLSQMPSTTRVLKELKRSKFIVYFGLYQNETSEIANLVIPSCTFLEKEDIRYSYMSEYIYPMPKVKEVEYGISEYDLTKKLSEKFGFNFLKSEKEYIQEMIKDNSFIDEEGYLKSKLYQNYKTQIDLFKKFTFLDDFEDEEEEKGEFYLITSKSKKSLNSQFKRDDFLYVPTNLPLKEGDEVKLSNSYGEATFRIKIDKRLRKDCLLLYSGNRKVNYLTPPKISNRGEMAIYQETKVNLLKS